MRAPHSHRRGTAAGAVLALLVGLLGVAPAAAADDLPEPDAAVVAPLTESDEAGGTPPTTDEDTAPEPGVGSDEDHAEEPAEQPAAEPATAAGSLRWTGELRPFTHKLPKASGPEVVPFDVSAYGLLALDASTVSNILPGRVTVTLEAPAGVELTGDEAADFAALQAAAPLRVAQVVAAEAANKPGSGVAAGINFTPTQSATHRIYAVLMAPAGPAVYPDAGQMASRVSAAVAHTDAYWSKQSAGKIRFELRGVSDFSQATAGGTCASDTALTNLWNQARAKAVPLGYNSARFNDHLVIVLPEANEADCGLGLGTLGYSVNTGGVLHLTNLSTDAGFGTLSHELGHNMSFGHANWLECRVPSFSSSLNLTISGPNYGVGTDQCVNREYGDLLDVMGFSILDMTGGALSAPNAIRAGLWAQGTDYKYAPRGKTQRFTIKDVGEGKGLRAVVIQDNTGAQFFVEYRNLRGTDAQYQTIGEECQVSEPEKPYQDRNGFCLESGVRVLRADNDVDMRNRIGSVNGAPWDQTQLIGRSVASVTGTVGRDVHRSTYRAGETFQNRSNVWAVAVKVKVISTSASSAVIEVTSPASGPISPNLFDQAYVWSESEEFQVGRPIWWTISDEFTGQQYTYQWYRVNLYTLKSTAISGANKPSYTPTAKDLGYALRARLIVKSDGKQSKARWSNYVVNYDEYWDEFYGIVEQVVAGTGTVTIVEQGSSLRARVDGYSQLEVPFKYQWFRNGKAISGATKATYKPVAADRLAALTVRVTPPTAGYDFESTASVTSAQGYYGIVSSQKPVVQGSVRVGATVVAEVGNFRQGPGGSLIVPTLSYQWLRDGKTIKHATGATYTLVAADKGKKISVKVSAKLGALVALTETSVKTAKVSAGVIAGSKTPDAVTRNAATGVLDAALTAGVITEPGVTVKYQWYRAGKAIKGATKASYKPVNADFDKTLKVRVTVTKKAYTTVVIDRAVPKSLYQIEWFWSKFVGPYVAVGYTLEANNLQFYVDEDYINHPDTTLTRTWQWYRNGKAIAGATGPTYLVTAADLGKRLSMRTTFAYDGWVGGSVLSRETAPVGQALFWDTPTAQQQWEHRGLASDSVVDDKVVLAAPSPGTGAGTDGIGDLDAKRSYQWYRGGKAIKGATKSTYVPGKADGNGALLHVRILITQAGYTQVEHFTTARAFSVYGASKPKIVGKAKVGVVLEAALQGTARTQENTNAGSESTNDIAVTFQWLRDGKAIAGATGASYQLVKADAGKRITVRVSYTHDSNGAVPLVLTSAKTAKVAK